MHELSIAINLVELASAAAAEHVGRVASVRVRIGVVSGVEPAALRCAFELAAAGSPLAGSRLDIIEVPLVVYCPQCRRERPARGLQRCCSVCSAPAAELRSGAELELVALEIEA